mmetsp:Transcript_85119/g.237514  ORF Transcript_85119/g.237514 Transcript_85119/m.237514 type:complete len:641 (-) Transcript_85119:127-2049(-)
MSEIEPTHQNDSTPRGPCVFLLRGDFQHICGSLEEGSLSGMAASSALREAAFRLSEQETQPTQADEANRSASFSEAAALCEESPRQAPSLPGQVSPACSSAAPRSERKVLVQGSSFESSLPSFLLQADSSARKVPCAGQESFTLVRSTSSRLLRALERTNTQVSAKAKVSAATKARLKELFNKFDEDNSGFLSKEELRAVAENNMALRDREAINKILEQAIARVDKDNNDLLDYEEFLELTVEEQPSIFQSYPLLFEALLCVAYLATAPPVYCSFNDDQGKWSFWDAFYFSIVTLTTIGYGDFVPLNDGMRLFTILYIIFGLAIVAQIAEKVVLLLVKYYEGKVQQLGRNVTEALSQSVGRLHRGSRTSSGFTAALYSRSWPFFSQCVHCSGATPETRYFVRKLGYAALLFTLPIVLATIFFSVNEDWPWLHAFYWSVVTGTTVGYGDLKLKHESSRIFSVLFIPTGFACVGVAIGNIAAIRVELAMDRQKRKLLSKSLSIDMLEDMDKDGNGVDRCEFVCAMLVQLNKVTQEDLVPLLMKFDDLDVDGSGVLTQQDMDIRKRQRQRMGRTRKGMACIKRSPTIADEDFAAKSQQDCSQFMVTMSDPAAREVLAAAAAPEDSSTRIGQAACASARLLAEP